MPSHMQSANNTELSMPSKESQKVKRKCLQKLLLNAELVDRLEALEYTVERWVDRSLDLQKINPKHHCELCMCTSEGEKEEMCAKDCKS